MTESPLTTRELARIAAINESGRRPVVLVHGLWLLAESWAAWEAVLADQGYAPIALDWPGDPATVDEARADPQRLAGTAVGDVVARVEDAIARLDRRPVLVGHSFGGLVVQILAGRGLARATIAIDPAPFKGILGLPWSVVRSTFPVLRNPLNRRRAVTLDLEQLSYGFANAIGADEAAALHGRHHVAAPGGPVFQAAFANLLPSRATKVDTRHDGRGPLLVVSGGADHTVPPSVAKAAFRKQAKNAAVTELVDIPDAGHSLVIDGRWCEVADATIDFLERNGVGADAPDPANRI